MLFVMLLPRIPLTGCYVILMPCVQYVTEGAQECCSLKYAGAEGIWRACSGGWRGALEGGSHACSSWGGHQAMGGVQHSAGQGCLHAYTWM